MNEWICVDDALPEEGRTILYVYFPGWCNVQRETMYRFFHGDNPSKPETKASVVRFAGNDGFGNYIELEELRGDDPDCISHWMYLPEPPEIENIYDTIN